ncbi:MAG: 2-hydroxyacyl-CoA dehydratase [Deltaproteobacteria bacterium]|nr:2-hydroxyacyl-CoA dehydratase [Deltaproteobacteria bacterium]
MTNNALDQVIDRFREVSDRPYEWLRQWKKDHNAKIAGCSPMHFPEELVHASGMLPVVLQETEETVTEGFSRVHSFFCGITRNVLDLAAKGKLDVFDNVLYSNICIQNTNAALSLKQILPKGRVAYVQLPTSLTRKTAMDDALMELERTKATLAEMSGRTIEDEAINHSIGVYNRHRALLRELHKMCGANPDRLSFSTRQAIIRSGMVMPREAHTGLLEQLLESLEGIEPRASGGKRLFLSGHLCQAPKSEILDLIEGVGGRIVDDDLYTGYRYYALDAETGGDPMESLAARSLDTSIPVPTRSDGKIRWDKYILDRARESRSEGVVVLLAKYCEPHLFSYPFIKKTLADAGMPHIMIETEHEAMSLEGVKTRLQAFMEMLT